MKKIFVLSGGLQEVQQAIKDQRAGLPISENVAPENAGDLSMTFTNVWHTRLEGLAEEMNDRFGDEAYFSIGYFNDNPMLQIDF